MNEEIRKLSNRRLKFRQTIKAVAWGFFGVRKNKGYDTDIATINPIYLIVAGIIAAIVFVVGLVLIAKWFANSMT